jgi:hypothetical protein
MKLETRSLAERAFHTSLLILGIAIALNVAVAYLQAVWPWIVGVLAIGSTVWGVIAIVRWRRSRW